MGRKTGAAITCILCAVFLLAVSCASSPSDAPSSRFSLVRSTETTVETGLLMGTVNYGAGFYLPSSADILDISLLRTDGTTGLVTEISHQRIRNILRFPVQFTVRYDLADIGESDRCTLIVTFYADDAVAGQGMTMLRKTDGGFADAVLTVYSV